ncbi:MAG: anhydro-N-acetylmuramic acid kinase, partial [Lysobacterales bacterium]
MNAPELYLGLISGTSADGIDAALVFFDGDAPRLVLGQTHAYPAELRESLLMISQATCAISLDTLGELDQRVGMAFAEAAITALEAAGVSSGDVAAIGSHGQTLRHRPLGPHPFTLQIGDPNIIAERTGIRTVADFRRRDVAAGGHGAPLLPALHAALFADTSADVAVLNLGGIGNLTLLPRAGSVRGFDTGPAN